MFQEICAPSYCYQLKYIYVLMQAHIPLSPIDLNFHIHSTIKL